MISWGRNTTNLQWLATSTSHNCGRELAHEPVEHSFGRQRGQVSWLLISGICSATLGNVILYIRILPYQKVTIFHWQYLINLFTLTPTVHNKWITVCCSTLVHGISGTEWLKTQAAKDNWMVKARKWCVPGCNRIKQWGHLFKSKSERGYFLTYLPICVKKLPNLIPSTEEKQFHDILLVALTYLSRCIVTNFQLHFTSVKQVRF
jgi:hypothetical protein